MSYLDKIKTTLALLKPELSHKYHVRSIGLFGSVVRADFSEEKSDIDMVVDFSEPIGIEFVDLADYLEKKLSRKIDLVSKNGIKERYLEEIQSEIIYF